MTSDHKQRGPHTTLTVKDPVCGMDVDPGTAEFISHHGGNPFYFCSGRCKTTFEANPEQYARVDRLHDGGGHDHERGGAASVPPDAEVTEYTCPMHPEIRQSELRACPICGMALEPVTDGDSRFWSNPRSG